MILLCFNVRYSVVLNGRKTVHEALVKQSLHFSDRMDYYINTIAFNAHSKGKEMSLFYCLLQMYLLTFYLQYSFPIHQNLVSCSKLCFTVVSVIPTLTYTVAPLHCFLL